MGMGMSLEVSWCSADGLASGLERSTPCTVGPVFIAGLSAILKGKCALGPFLSVLVI
jgi:hypothetical protein